jgi:hypothetical protein
MLGFEFWLEIHHLKIVLVPTNKNLMIFSIIKVKIVFQGFDVDIDKYFFISKCGS